MTLLQTKQLSNVNSLKHILKHINQSNHYNSNNPTFVAMSMVRRLLSHASIGKWNLKTLSAGI